MKEVFLVEYKGKTALFAPLKGLIMKITETEKKKVFEVIGKKDFVFDDVLFLFPMIDRAKLYSKNPLTEIPKERDNKFLPSSLILFPTFDCNLRCIYCYSKAGEQKINMEWQIAKAAINFVIKNAVAKMEKEVILEFHGGGEPTYNWKIFEAALNHFRKKAARENLLSKTNLATNGLLSMNKVDWIADNIDSVQVSLDGMEDIQNFQRPTKGGDKSFSSVVKTIERFLAKKKRITVHCVVTDKGIKNIPEIVCFLATSFPGITIHLEPVCECGRWLQKGQKFPSADLFISGFIEAESAAESLGAELHYSGATFQLANFRQGFCGVFSPNFVVTPTGKVSACHEAAGENHLFAKFFIYGHFDKGSGEFVFDYEKIKNLRRCVDGIEALCGDCFVKYYCAGECLTKSLNMDGTRKFPGTNPRCRINQELTKHFVFKNFVEGGENQCKQPLLKKNPRQSNR